MHGGVKSFICLASLAAGGCAATQTADVQVRPIGDSSAKLRPGSELADGYAQLALGNVGLAIEGFRKALRENPNSADAYSGLARAYEAMGRADLARTNYEAALALTPKDPQLLTAVAVALDQQGKAKAAAMARQEAASIAASVPPLPATEPQVSIPAPQLSSSVTVMLPPARPADSLAAQRVRVAETRLPTAPYEAAPMVAAAPVAAPPQARAPEIPAAALASTVTVALPPARPARNLAVRAVALTELPPLRAPMDEQPSAAATGAMLAVRPASFDKPAVPAPVLSGTVTVMLPPARPADRLAASAPTPPMTLPPLREPVDRRTQELARAVLPVPRGPYLERLSMGEVALVTDGRPAWHSQALAQARSSTMVRWVPIMTAEARPNIRIFNAAQRQGMAANARNMLLDRGWRKIEIGNALAVRERSVVLYPMSRQRLGRSLAAQFGFEAQASPDAKALIVLLGRDAQRAPRKRG
jgi:hypothetical protein